MDVLSPESKSRYERLRNNLLENNANHSPSEGMTKWNRASITQLDSITDEELESFSEESPLLRVLRNSKHDGGYQSIPHGVSAPTNDIMAFRPTRYAELALRSLLDGILVYVLCSIVGLGVVALKFENIVANSVSWWIVFGPFWAGNVSLMGAHGMALVSTKTLYAYAESDVYSNEPLKPLLRRVCSVYAVTIPLMVLFLWSEIAFCARLDNKHAASLYICYTPLIVIQAAFVVRYVLCKAHSHVPGVSWTLILAFTVLLAYQTNAEWHEWGYYTTDGMNQIPVLESHYKLAWWMVLAPLFGFDFVMIGCLLFIVVHVAKGYYKFERWQYTASILYVVALVVSMLGQFMLWEEIEFSRETFTFPSILIFTALVMGSVAFYIIAKRYVQTLMATRGGAVPVPLRQTKDGWISSVTGADRWLLMGDIAITALGRKYWSHRFESRVFSQVETDGEGFNIFSYLCCMFRKPLHETNNASPNVGLEYRMPKTLTRRNSGSYHDVSIEDQA